MDANDTKLLIKIAEMYYLEDKNQSQISKELNIHRSTISRLLKRSRNEGIVDISINYDISSTYILERELQEKYSLEKVIVLSMADNLVREQKDRLLAKSLDNYLKEILKDNMIIGFSWGETMSMVSQELSDFSVKNILCLPLIGGPSGKLSSDFHVNTIVYEASKKLNGHALLIDSPAIPETISLKKALLENEFNQKIIEYWRKVDIALVGIGSPSLKNSDNWKQFYGENVFEYLEEKNVVGDVTSRFYNIDGKHVNNDLDDRLIGIDTSDFKRIPYRVAVAESTDKGTAIRAALKGKYINVLVTTEKTAKVILKE